MKNIIYIICLTLFFVNYTYAADTSSNGLQVYLQVDNSCNNNLICEPGLGETINNCPSDCFVPVVGSGGGGGRTTHMINNPSFFKDLFITVENNRVIINWNSDVPVLRIIRWGKTLEYKDGISRSVFFEKKHEVVIGNLSSQTQYYFFIEIQSIDGTKKEYPGYFITLKPQALYVPENPAHFKTIHNNKGVFLKWLNPQNIDFSYVRIMRNTDHFYTNPFLGTLVYEGKTESIIDKNVLPGNTYYYSLFGRNIDGSFSSGVGSKIYYFDNKKVVNIEPPVVQKQNSKNTIISFLQKENTIEQSNGVLNAVPKEPIIINIKNLPQGLNDAWIAIYNTKGEDVYLLSKGNNLSQTSISNLNSGDYQFKIFAEIKNEVVVLDEGSISVNQTDITEEKPQENNKNYFLANDEKSLPFSGFLLKVLGVISIILLFRLRKIIPKRSVTGN